MPLRGQAAVLLLCVRVALALVLLSVVSPAVAQTLAVLPFANQTGDPSLDPLGRGLADMFVTDLSVVESLTLVERSRLEEVMSELNLQASELIDPKTAAKKGRGIGATHLLTGSVVAMAPTVRIDARIIEVESATVVLSTSSSGPKEDFFYLEKELADKVIAELGLVVTTRERAKLGRLPTESFPAFFAWSRGLDAEARGDAAAAAKAIEEALAHDSSFAEAAAMLETIRSRVADAGAASDEVFAAQVVEILREIERVKEGAPPDQLSALALPYLQATSTLSARQRYTVSVRALELGLPETVGVVIAPGAPPRSFNEIMLYERVNSALFAGLIDEILSWGPTYVERYPGSPFAVSVRGIVQQALSYSTKREEGLKQVSRVRAEAHNAALQLRCEAARPLQEQLKVCETWLRHAANNGIDLGGHDVGAVRTAVYLYADPAEMTRYAAIFAALPDGQDDAEFLLERASAVKDRRGRLPAKEEKDLALDTRSAFNRLVALQDAGEWERWARLADALVERWATDAEKGERILIKALEGAKELRDYDRGVRWRDIAAAQGLKLAPVRIGWVEDLDRQAEKARWADAEEAYELADGLRSLGLHEEAVEAYLALRRDYPEYPRHNAEKALASAAHQAYTGLYPWHHEVSRALYIELAAEATDPTLKSVADSMLSLPAR